MVLGWSVNGGFIRQQYAPNHPSSHRKFSDFLSSLNHRAIQFADKERPEHIQIPFLLFILTDQATSEDWLVYVCGIVRVKICKPTGLEWAGKLIYTLPFSAICSKPPLDE